MCLPFSRLRCPWGLLLYPPCVKIMTKNTARAYYNNMMEGLVLIFLTMMEGLV